MTRLCHILTISLAALCLLSSTIFAQDADMDPQEQAKMIEEYAKLAAPGDEHMLLQSMAGTWEITSKLYMAPGQEPMIHTGTSENKMILGGRFLQSNAHTEGAGMETDILGILGYDKRHKVYTSIGLDTWGTYYVTAQGHYDEKTKKMVLSGEDVDPVAGFTQVYDYVYDFSEDNKIVMEVIFKNPEMTHGQDEFRMVEVVYTRPAKK